MHLTLPSRTRSAAKPAPAAGTVPAGRKTWFEVLAMLGGAGLIGYYGAELTWSAFRSVLDFFDTEENNVNGRLFDVQRELRTAREALDALVAEEEELKAKLESIRSARAEAAAETPSGE